MTFWDNVKKEIIKQNTTQEWVANAVGMDHGAFRSALSKRQEPRISKAIAVSKALGVSVEYLYYGKEQTKTYEELELLKLAIRFKDIIEILDSLDKRTLEMIRIQVNALASSNNTEDMVAEPGASYGPYKKKAT